MQEALEETLGGCAVAPILHQDVEYDPVLGRMSTQVGASCLERGHGGAGVLLGGVPGVPPGKVVVLGGGVSGSNAARVAIGMGADVTVIDRSLPRLREGVVHYCVTNMPGAVARTSTIALGNATLPFILSVAGQGWRAALFADQHLRRGLNVHDGEVTHAAVAHDLGLNYRDPDALVTA